METINYSPSSLTSSTNLNNVNMEKFQKVNRYPQYVNTWTLTGQPVLKSK